MIAYVWSQVKTNSYPTKYTHATTWQWNRFLEEGSGIWRTLCGLSYYKHIYKHEQYFDLYVVLLDPEYL